MRKSTFLVPKCLARNHLSQRPAAKSAIDEFRHDYVSATVCLWGIAFVTKKRYILCRLHHKNMRERERQRERIRENGSESERETKNLNKKQVTPDRALEGAAIRGRARSVRLHRWPDPQITATRFQIKPILSKIWQFCQFKKSCQICTFFESKIDCFSREFRF